MRQIRSLSAENTLFLILEGTLYLTFLSLDLSGRSGGTHWLKYAGILLCFLFALYRHSLPGAPALAFSACADWFLLVRGDHFLHGVLLFLCVQTCHLLFLHRRGAGFALPLRLGLSGILLTVLVLSGLADLLTVAAAIYLAQLISNIVVSRRVPSAGRLTVGLTMMLCCDICVGIAYLSPLLPALLPAAQVGMWLFYLPSQVLIAFA